jgi:hypothetical protein
MFNLQRRPLRPLEAFPPLLRCKERRTFPGCANRSEGLSFDGQHILQGDRDAKKRLLLVRNA